MLLKDKFFNVLFLIGILIFSNCSSTPDTSKKDKIEDKVDESNKDDDKNNGAGTGGAVISSPKEKDNSKKNKKNKKPVKKPVKKPKPPLGAQSSAQPGAKLVSKPNNETKDPKGDAAKSSSNVGDNKEKDPNNTNSNLDEEGDNEGDEGTDQLSVARKVRPTYNESGTNQIDPEPENVDNPNNKKHTTKKGDSVLTKGGAIITNYYNKTKEGLAKAKDSLAKLITGKDNSEIRPLENLMQNLDKQHKSFLKKFKKLFGDLRVYIKTNSVDIDEKFTKSINELNIEIKKTNAKINKINETKLNQKLSILKKSCNENKTKIQNLDKTDLKLSNEFANVYSNILDRNKKGTKKIEEGKSLIKEAKEENDSEEAKAIIKKAQSKLQSIQKYLNSTNDELVKFDKRKKKFKEEYDKFLSDYKLAIKDIDLLKNKYINLYNKANKITPKAPTPPKNTPPKNTPPKKERVLSLVKGSFNSTFLKTKKNNNKFFILKINTNLLKNKKINYKKSKLSYLINGEKPDKKLIKGIFGNKPKTLTDYKNIATKKGSSLKTLIGTKAISDDQKEFIYLRYDYTKVEDLKDITLKLKLEFENSKDKFEYTLPLILKK